jgi:hypothetical protein
VTPSFLDELRDEAQEARRHAEKVIAVPGSAFAVRFRPPAREKLDVVLAGVRANALTEDEELQFIIDCHDEVLRRNGGGEAEPVDPGGGPLRFDGSDPRWGLEDHGTARQAVAKLYHLDVHPLAVSGHVELLLPWLQGVEAEIARTVQTAGKDRERER